jgi:lipid-binding SYLF domain-containing protein
LFTSSSCQAQSKEAIDANVVLALRQFDSLDPRNESLVKAAAGVLVFPQITKGGVAIAAEYGEGVLEINGATAGYYRLASASVGLTAGMATRSEIILFMTQEALDKFMKSRGWSIGAATGIAVISKGAAGDYDSNTLKKPILGFVFAEKGLIADLSFEGSKVKKIEK